MTVLAQIISPVSDIPDGSIRSFMPSAAQQKKLNTYLTLLQKWNSTYNLTAIRKADEMRTLHLNDCLAIVPHFPDEARVLDVGTGGGLPGIVLAICKPQLTITLCDAVQKKCAFLQQVKGELALDNVQVMHARVEDLQGEFDVITSRAFAELALMVQLTRHLLSPTGHWLAMKAAIVDKEYQALPKDIHAQTTALDVAGLDAARCLVTLKKIPA
jgi:16S rRNA (guanine527-N7)-methyltransferase